MVTPSSKRKRILTGDRPTGKLHLGHYVGSLMNRVKYQDEYETFILVADIQALTTHWERPELLRQAVLDVTMDNLAVGLDPKKVTFCIQSLIPEIAELTIIYGLFTNMNKLRHNPTTKSEALQYGYISGDDIIAGFDQLTYGFFGYPVSQAADITFVRANAVPVGDDQLPHIELTRDIARKFNTLYGCGVEIIPEPKAIIGEVARLRGLDGDSKMSKSLGNVINLSDDEKAVADVVRKGVTDPEKIRKNDPGHPDICNIYAYHKVFQSTLNKQAEAVTEIDRDCKSGALGCVECKGRLTKVLNELLAPIRERRKPYEENPQLVWDILEEGNVKAREEGAKTMALVKAAMKIDYPVK